jgi:hypothetical protein
MRRRLMRITTRKPLRIERPPRKVFLVRGGTRSAPAQHNPVLTEKIRSEDGVPSMLPRQGGDQPLPCLRKAVRWLLAPPKNRVDGAERQRRTSPFLDPLPWTGATSLCRPRPPRPEDNSCPAPWPYCGNPFPKLIRGRWTSAL